MHLKILQCSSQAEYFSFYKDNFYPQCLTYLYDKDVQNFIEMQPEFMGEIQAHAPQGTVESSKSPNF